MVSSPIYEKKKSLFKDKTYSSICPYVLELASTNQAFDGFTYNSEQELPLKNRQGNLRFVKIRSVTVMLYSKKSMNLYPYVHSS